MIKSLLQHFSPIIFFFFLRVSINKCQGVAKSTRMSEGGIKNTHRFVILWMWHLLDVILKSFIEHCQICKLHRDGHNVYIMPFLYVFENVKLRTLLTFYGLAHYITARNIWFSAQCKSSLKCVCHFFLIPFCLRHILNVVFSFSKSCLIDTKSEWLFCVVLFYSKTCWHIDWSMDSSWAVAVFY